LHPAFFLRDLQKKVMTKELQIEKTRYTPYIHLRKGNISFEGRSVLNDPYHLYQPVYEWIREYVKEKPSPTHINLKFEYINTSSMKWVFEILRIFREKPELKDKLSISWYYEEGDDDMRELGEILKSFLNSSFQLIETPE
jgi:hypothetical protein